MNAPRIGRVAIAVAAVGVAALAAITVSTGAGASAPAATSDTAAPPATKIARGRNLFELHCATCHGADGRGTRQGPSVVRAGAAAADFQLSTGRMPLDAPTSAPVRKPPAFGRADIDAITAFVGSLDDGPPVPDVDLKHTDISAGQQLFSSNCAPCHSAAGAGGALGRGITAPSLSDATPRQVVEAMRTGPGPMPVFGSDTLSPAQANDIARYVQYLHHPTNAGGLSLGRVGPIPEGFVAWLVGLGVLLLFCRWIGARE